MEFSRVSAIPRLSCARRVLARKRLRPPDASANSARKLQRREIGAGPRRAFAASVTRERFRNIQLQEEFDTHDPKANSFLLPFLSRRSEIVEIVGARDIIFDLSQSGVCAAFSRVTNQLICLLNESPDEVIRGLFYNKANDSIITVSIYGSEGFSALSCRTTRLEYIRQGEPDAGFPLFETESLKWLSHVEFDDVNGKVLTHSAQDSTYKVFDLKSCTLLYTISDKNVEEIKISPGTMLLIYSRKEGYVPLEVLSIEDGRRLRSFNHLLHRSKKIDFIEQFNEKLLVKQEGENLQILDLRDFNLAEVSGMGFMTSSAFIFLHDMQLFLTFHSRLVSVWNYRGELVTSFDDHLFWHPDCSDNSFCITGNKDLIISYCRADPKDSSSDENACSINISEIVTGKVFGQNKGR